VGPKMCALGQSVLAAYNIQEISSYITTVLHEYSQKDSYGLFAGLDMENSEQPESIPTIIFGIPKVDVTRADLPPTPYGLPTLVNHDSIVSMKEFGGDPRWAIRPVVDMEEIKLQGISIGVEGF